MKVQTLMPESPDDSVDVGPIESEPNYRTLVEYASDITTIVGVDGLISYESPALQRVLGYSPEALVGTDPFLLAHPTEAIEIGALFAEMSLTHLATAITCFRSRHADGSWRWMDVTGTNLLDDPGIRGIVINSRDVTERHEAEERHRDLLEAAQRQARELALLGEVRTALAREVELPDLFRTVVEAVARTFGYSLVSLYLLDDDVLVMQHQVGYDRQIERIPVSEGVAGRVVRTDTPVLIRDVREDTTFLGAIPGIVSEICVPLHDQGEVAGILNLESIDNAPLTEADLNLMVALSDHVNVALGRSRLYTEVRRNAARFQALVQYAADMVSVVDATGLHTYASPAYALILGYDPDDLIGTPIAALSGAGDRQFPFHRLTDLAERPNALDRFEVAVRHRDGSRRWLEVIAANHLADPNIHGIVVTSRDITARKIGEAEQLQRERQALLRANISIALAAQTTLVDMLRRCAEVVAKHFETAVAGIWLRDDKTCALELHAAVGVQTDQSASLAQSPMGQLNMDRIVGTGASCLTNDLVNDALADHSWARREGMTAFAAYPLHGDDQVIGAIALYSKRPLAEDTPENLAVVESGITHELARNALEARLWHQAHHDALTGLPNRTLFLNRLAQALESPNVRVEQAAVQMLFLDLDGFKVINDSLGHDRGDRLLVLAADRFASQLRDQDMIARFGGDEFAVLVGGTNNEYSAVTVARRFVAALRQPFIFDGHEILMSASIGIVDVPHLTQPTDVFRAADVALYRAKDTGKGGYVVFDPTRDASALVRLDQETELRHALDREELQVVYQPIIELSTGSVVGIEALARWDHPTRGWLASGSFIPLAEETGLILPLGRWLRQAACLQLRKWNDRFGQSGPLQLSVNLSAREFRQPDLIVDLTRTLKSAGLSPGDLTLEVIESVALTEADEAIATMHEIKALGFRLALDDFGTGYASLNTLRRIPIDELKIDHSFIAGLGRHREDTAIVRATIGVATALGLAVTAEGIETASQLAALRDLGCDRGQGYRFAAPCSAGELETFLNMTRHARATTWDDDPPRPSVTDDDDAS